MAESKYVTTSVQLTPAQHAALREIARAQGVTVSAVMRWALAAWLPTPETPPT